MPSPLSLIKLILIPSTVSAERERSFHPRHTPTKSKIESYLTEHEVNIILRQKQMAPGKKKNTPKVRNKNK